MFKMKRMVKLLIVFCEKCSQTADQDEDSYPFRAGFKFMALNESFKNPLPEEFHSGG